MDKKLVYSIYIVLSVLVVMAYIPLREMLYMPFNVYNGLWGLVSLLIAAGGTLIVYLDFRSREKSKDLLAKVSLLTFFAIWTLVSLILYVIQAIHDKQILL